MLNHPFPWRCPFCNQNATITKENYSKSIHHLRISNKLGYVCSVVEFTVCPNPECSLFALTTSLHKTVHMVGEQDRAGALLKTWSLIPVSNAKVFPDYVPEPVRNDYTEACAILGQSPKASATLARRALQGMIRDFWGIKKPNLKQEIEALEEKVDPLVWDAIDGVRKLGNIGAHMEKDINLIIDVEPEEAEKLIWLIEFLVDDWYVARHNRQASLRAIGELADVKESERHVEGS